MSKKPLLIDVIAAEINGGWLSLFLFNTEYILASADDPVSRHDRYKVRVALQRVFTPDQFDINGD